jgi:hypothetical protein
MYSGADVFILMTMLHPEMCLLVRFVTQTLIIRRSLYYIVTWFLINFTIVDDIV